MNRPTPRSKVVLAGIAALVCVLVAALWLMTITVSNTEGGIGELLFGAQETGRPAADVIGDDAEEFVDRVVVGTFWGGHLPWARSLLTGEVTIVGSWGAAVLWAAIVAAAEAGKRWLRRRALRRL